MGDLERYFIYPMCVMPVVLIAAARVISYVRGYYLERDEHEGEERPYLGFFLQTTGIGIALAAVIYLCGQLVLGAAVPEDVMAQAGDRVELAGQLLAAAALTRCFICAAAVTAFSCATSVAYLKLLAWRDEHDRNTSGTAPFRIGGARCLRALFRRRDAFRRRPWWRKRGARWLIARSRN